MPKSSPSSNSGLATFLRGLTTIVVVAGLIWVSSVYFEIEKVANTDEAQTADAIAVFGAAEYSGRPSPVFHARLDHAVDLYREHVAPLIITLGGGSDKDSGNTEGGVGRDYLLANGVPFGSIIAETRSTDTEQQVHRLAAIAHENNLQHIVVVSDGTHLFRIRELCKDVGLDVYTSPRPTLGHISKYDMAMRYFHEIVSYTALRLHVDLSWFEGKSDV
jgi:uncharacterized SAM-binding protein YcdF (DUF218 family)